MFFVPFLSLSLCPFHSFSHSLRLLFCSFSPREFCLVFVILIIVRMVFRVLCFSSPFCFFVWICFCLCISCASFFLNIILELNSVRLDGRSFVHSFPSLLFFREISICFFHYMKIQRKKCTVKWWTQSIFFLLDDPLYPTSVYSTLDSCTFIHFNSFLVCSLVAIYIRLSFSCAANVHIVYSVCTRWKSTVQMLMLSKFSVVFLFFVCFLHLQPIERNTIPINYCSPER